MMLVPRNNDFDFLGDIFDDSFFKTRDSRVMKTDIKEHDNNYELLVELPGFTKDNINISMEDGYLTIEANSDTKSEKKEDGKYVRRERYTGTFSRSFYVGDNITEDDIKASFKNGVLNIAIPKKEIETKSDKKYIEIED